MAMVWPLWPSPTMMAVAWPLLPLLSPYCGSVAFMAILLLLYPYCGHNGLGWPLWLLCDHPGWYAATVAIMARVMPLWLWCSHYGCGAPTKVVAWPPWMYCGLYGHCVAAMVNLWLQWCATDFWPCWLSYDLAILPAAAALTLLHCQNSHDLHSQMERQLCGC